MARVLILAARDLERELGATILWRPEVPRVSAPPDGSALAVAAAVTPNLVVLDAQGASAVAMLRALRGHPGTRRASLVALSRSPTLEDEEELRQAGANLVLAGEVDPTLWDARLEELLTVPQRRAVPIPLLFNVWARFGPDAEGTALNLSVRGLLLESEEALDVGTRLDLRFGLPGHGDELRAVGQVVREEESAPRPRSGIEFLILRGDAREKLAAFVARETEP